MLRRTLTSLALVCAFVLSACSDSTMPTSPNATDELREIPSLSFVNGPATPGESPIERGDAPWCYWCATLDAESNLYTTHQSAYDYFCNAGPVVEWDYQELNNGGHTIINAQARDKPLFIYNMTDMFEHFAAGLDIFCPFLANEWLYQGTQNMTANERYSTDSSSWLYQMSAQGVVYDHDGTRYHFTNRQKRTSDKGWTHQLIQVK